VSAADNLPGVGTRFTVRLTPRSSSDRVTGVGPGGVLQACVVAPPVEGAANRALTKLLARELRVPLSSIALETGAGSRLKRVLARGVREHAVMARWPGLGTREVRAGPR
jgi:uncharacterized protein